MIGPYGGGRKEGGKKPLWGTVRKGSKGNLAVQYGQEEE